MRGWTVPLLSIVTIAACSFARDLDGFSDEFGAAGDGGRAPPDGGPSDASPDGTPIDGGWCTRNANAGVFCEDFDVPDAAPLARFLVTDEGGGTLAIDSASLVCRAPASQEGPSTASASKYGAMTAVSASLGADVRFEKVNAKNSGSAQPLSLFFESGAISYQVGIGVRGQQGTASVFEYTDPDEASFTILGAIPPIADGTFHRVELTVDLGAGTVRVNVDGVDATGLPKLTPGVRSGRALAIAGIGHADENHDGWTVRVDNITFASQ